MAEGDTYKASCIYRTDNGQAIVYDFSYMDTSTGATPIDMGIAAGNFQTLVQATLLAALPSVVKVNSYRFACVKGVQIGQIGHVESSAAEPGGLGAAHLPAEIAISMKRNTGFSSRKDRGRIFFGPVSLDLGDGDNPDLCDYSNALLTAVRDLLKANLTVSTRILKPVILAPDGTPSGHFVVNVAVGKVFVHRKTRRFKVLG